MARASLVEEWLTPWANLRFHSLVSMSRAKPWCEALGMNLRKSNSTQGLSGSGYQERSEHCSGLAWGFCSFDTAFLAQTDYKTTDSTNMTERAANRLTRFVVPSFITQVFRTFRTICQGDQEDAPAGKGLIWSKFDCPNPCQTKKQNTKLKKKTATGIVWHVFEIPEPERHSQPDQQLSELQASLQKEKHSKIAR